MSVKQVFLPVFLLLALALTGCAASTGNVNGEIETTRVAHDPWEPANRTVFAFNRGLDKVTLRPVARGYRRVLPRFVRTGIGNFFSNLTTPVTIVNQLLQGKGGAAVSDAGRLLLNSTVGIGGLFDPATAAGLERHDEDFGQTLAVWGVPDGPFVTVPLLGPRTLRDATMIPLNLLAYPLIHYNNTSVRDKLLVLQAVHVRARLLPAETLIAASNDPYVTVRESWLQNRRFKIYDGDPPGQDDDLFDEFVEE